MSFLNPIELPVKIYKSTDTRAPQLDVNKRTNDEYLTIFKACLVTGFGEKQGAGWTMEDKPGNGGVTNQRAANTAIFKPPHVLMDDYRYEMTETQAGLYFVMSYQGQVVPDNSGWQIGRNFNKTPSLFNSKKQLSWVMLVTDLGYYFIEIVDRSDTDYRFARVSYFGQIKSGLVSDEGKNAMFWSFGANPYSVTITQNSNRYTHSPYSNQALEVQTLIGNLTHINNKNRVLSAVEITSPLFYIQNMAFLGQQPGLLVQSSNDEILGGRLSGVYETIHDGRPVLYVCLAGVVFERNKHGQGDTGAMSILLYLDTWEY